MKMFWQWKWVVGALLGLLLWGLASACYVPRRPLPPTSQEQPTAKDASVSPELWWPPVADEPLTTDKPQPDLRVPDLTGPPELRPEPMPEPPPEPWANPEPTPESVSEPIPDTPGSKPLVVTVCMTGGKGRDDSVNREFDALCQQLGAPRDCKDVNTCFYTFNQLSAGKAAKAMFEGLDTNKDGKVDQQDKPAQVNVIGFAWGGVTAKNAATIFLGDKRIIAARRRIDHMITINPYFSLQRTLQVPEGVAKYWSYRISQSQEVDCAKNKALGLYFGFKPSCSGSTRCRDYDYSLAQARVFTGSNLSVRGSEVGFCNILPLSLPSILHHVTTGLDTANPPPLGR